jgi:hypothetical protein
VSGFSATVRPILSKKEFSVLRGMTLERKSEPGLTIFGANAHIAADLKSSYYNQNEALAI